jgi:mitogen-activated protein kinase kinase kinase
MIAKNHRTMQKSRRPPEQTPLAMAAAVNGLPVNNSLTGTPMYMSPEVIKNDKRGRYGAMDIWSLGCVVLECATGKKPWSNLDNEWCVSGGLVLPMLTHFRAIMFHIGVATQHPPLPESGQLSELGIDFIKQCLIIDPMQRPTANELINHAWMLEFREALQNYEEVEMTNSPPTHLPHNQSKFENATVARQAAIIQEKQVEAMISDSPDISPLDTEQESDSDTDSEVGGIGGAL